MGLNIYLVRFTDNNEDRDEDFDSTRHAGDKEFCVAMAGRCDGRLDKYGEEGYWKPRKSEFDFARRWVVGNIMECNQKRLLDLLDRLEADGGLWLQSVY